MPEDSFTKGFDGDLPSSAPDALSDMFIELPFPDEQVSTF